MVDWGGGGGGGEGSTTTPSTPSLHENTHTHTYRHNLQSGNMDFIQGSEISPTSINCKLILFVSKKNVKAILRVSFKKDFDGRMQ